MFLINELQFSSNNFSLDVLKNAIIFIDNLQKLPSTGGSSLRLLCLQQLEDYMCPDPYSPSFWSNHPNSLW